MKIIGFEEHYGLPAIHEAALKANDPYALVLETLKKAGLFRDDPKTGCPAGIYDLGEGRIAAMDDAGIDVQILSHASPTSPDVFVGSRGALNVLTKRFTWGNFADKQMPWPSAIASASLGSDPTSGISWPRPTFIVSRTPGRNRLA